MLIGWGCADSQVLNHVKSFPTPTRHLKYKFVIQRQPTQLISSTQMYVNRAKDIFKSGLLTQSHLCVHIYVGHMIHMRGTLSRLVGGLSMYVVW